jgi:hypothetical protein
MGKRTKQDWQALITAQAKSGLTAAAFCRKHSVNAKYFSLRKKQLSNPDTPAFLPVQLTSPAGDDIHVDWQGVALRLPISISPQWIADFIHRLSA